MSHYELWRSCTAAWRLRKCNSRTFSFEWTALMLLMSPHHTPHHFHIFNNSVQLLLNSHLYFVLFNGALPKSSSPNPTNYAWFNIPRLYLLTSGLHVARLRSQMGWNLRFIQDLATGQPWNNIMMWLFI